jgi:hypothetical protein
MKYVHVEVTDWAALYHDGELLMEDHGISVGVLSQLSDSGIAIEVESIDGRSTDLDTEVSQRGGFKGLPLDRVRELAA